MRKRRALPSGAPAAMVTYLRWPPRSVVSAGIARRSLMTQAGAAHAGSLLQLHGQHAQVSGRHDNLDRLPRTAPTISR